MRPPDIVRATTVRSGASASEVASFYHLEEGSEVFPVDWFKALEREDGSGLFADDLERFGFIPDPAGPANPYGLPVGLTSADTRDLRWTNARMLGVNCAACHVSEVITPGGKAVRLDGAPGRVDVGAFYRGLARAVGATLQSPGRLLAFLGRLRTGGPRGATRADSEPSIGELDAILRAEEASPPIDITTGVSPKNDSAGAQATARLREQLTAPAPASLAPMRRNLSRAKADAIQDVIQTIRLLKARLAFLIALGTGEKPSEVPPGFGRVDAFGGARNLLWPQSAAPMTAPVSFPDLWTFDRLTWVHWDGNTTSVLERNIGQALGLGAVLDRSTMISTVSVVNLHQLEVIAAKLRPPRWEEIFGPIDTRRRDRGRGLFRDHCARCHVARVGELVDAAELGDVDANRAVNFAADLAGRPNDVVIAELVGRIKRKAFEEKGFTADQQRQLDNGRPAMWRAPKKYMVRPLIALWATAPYLHNNSVPTLDDLLLPPKDRRAVFYTGRREYDVKHLGFVSDDDGRNRFKFDTSVPGNRNTGHVFGDKLSESDRLDLLEYLKMF